MKRVIIVIAIVVVLLIIPVTVILLTNGAKVTGTATFFNNESVLDEKDAAELFDIINVGRRYLYDDPVPACGFGKGVSICLTRNNSEYEFYIAWDNCPCLYFKNEKKYLDISEGDREKINSILDKYGFKFPAYSYEP
ncbi:MAG: hypothetical protein IKN38_10525 [Clostridia bacterium]|nr:hypothetical protein [Clostridia bacterium]